MRRISRLLGCAAAATLFVTAASANQRPAAASTSADDQHIRHLQQEWMDAWVRQDLATIERILAPDYTLTMASMPARPVSREQWISMLQRYTAEDFEYRDMIVRVFDDIAVVSSIGRGIGAKVGGADRSFPFFLTDVWGQAQWALASCRASFIDAGSGH